MKIPPHIYLELPQMTNNKNKSLGLCQQNLFGYIELNQMDRFVRVAAAKPRFTVY